MQNQSTSTFQLPGETDHLTFELPPEPPKDAKKKKKGKKGGKKGGSAKKKKKKWFELKMIYHKKCNKLYDRAYYDAHCL